MNQLTKRESQVHGLLGEGLSDKQIAQRLGITPKTAGIHAHRVLRKLGYKRRNQIMLAKITQLQKEMNTGA
jgi:DNA-binding CsgD family transcriptional regulator